MEGRCKRRADCTVLVKMGDDGGEHDKSATGLDQDELTPRRMYASRVDRQARRKLRVAVVEHHAPRIIQPHNPAHVLDLERMGQPRIVHVAPGSIGQFALLEVKPRLWKAVEIAHMVVMQMGENDIFNRIRINAERGERLHSTAQKRALSPFRYFRLEPAIDHKLSAP